jgi:hypothetical protein
MSLLSLLGLIMAYIDIDMKYKERALVYPEPSTGGKSSVESDIIESIILLITFLAVAAGFVKEWFAMKWYTFRDPIKFHKAETQ